jgi:hypothetical protein
MPKGIVAFGNNFQAAHAREKRHARPFCSENNACTPHRNRSLVRGQYITGLNNFEKFSAMLAGAQNSGSDAGNLVSS